MGILLEYDEAVDAACLTVSDARWDHQVRLDDARGINYAADGSVVGIEILSPRRKGVLLDGLSFHADPTPRAFGDVSDRRCRRCSSPQVIGPSWTPAGSRSWARAMSMVRCGKSRVSARQ